MGDWFQFIFLILCILWTFPQLFYKEKWDGAPNTYPTKVEKKTFAVTKGGKLYKYLIPYAVNIGGAVLIYLITACLYESATVLSHGRHDPCLRKGKARTRSSDGSTMTRAFMWISEPHDVVNADVEEMCSTWRVPRIAFGL